MNFERKKLIGDTSALILKVIPYSWITAHNLCDLVLEASREEVNSYLHIGNVEECVEEACRELAREEKIVRKPVTTEQYGLESVHIESRRNTCD